MSISEWQEEIRALQEEAIAVPLAHLLSSSCPNYFIERVNAFVENMASKHELLIHVGIGSEVYRALEQSGIPREEFEAYARRYFDWRWIPFDEYFLQAVIMIYRPDIGLQIRSGVVDEVLSDLSYDSEGLLEYGQDDLSFQKDGVQHGDYYLRYSQEIHRYNLLLSGGFLESFTQFISSNDVVNAGVRINPDIILDRRYFFEYFTKAFIRGPKSISIGRLRDPSFPEDKSGTVSEYQRVDDDPVKRLLFEVDKIQVMWSAKDDTKTVQIEELVPHDSNMNENAEYVWNRYVHAIWDSKDECFSHFDGAVKVYWKDDYQDRLDCDIKLYDGKPSYKKLYRLDSAFDLATWCEMTAKYFYGNELVGEYFATEV